MPFQIGLDLRDSKWMSSDASTVVIAYAAHKVQHAMWCMKLGDQLLSDGGENE
jgi:hypothetical protein